MSYRYVRDLLANIDLTDATSSTMHVINALQQLQPHEQVLAVTATFKLLIERYCIRPQDAFTIADNVMNHAEGRRTEFKAVELYMENEL